MLCSVGTSSALELGDDGIFARVFFCGRLSAGLSPGSNFAEFQKKRVEGVLSKFAIARALRALWEPRFAAKCCAMLALQVQLN